MIIDVWINCPSDEVADNLAKQLMAARLVACANRYPMINSRYFWKGAIKEAKEVPLLVKTRKELFKSVLCTAKAFHPYETPSILCIDITAANQDYINWIYEETDTTKI